MAFFPFFINLTGQEGLIVGGGVVALRKIEKLLPYGAKLTVCAPEFHPEILAIPGLTLYRGTFEPPMIAGKKFVIAATDDRELNRAISELCQAKNILVNVVDDRELCGFVFPALVKQGELSIGISTGGASPVAAAYLKKQIAQAIPDNFDAILTCLNDLRAPVKTAVQSEKQRAEFFAAAFAACIAAGGPLSKEAAAEMLKKIAGDEAAL